MMQATSARVAIAYLNGNTTDTKQPRHNPYSSLLQKLTTCRATTVSAFMSEGCSIPHWSCSLRVISMSSVIPTSVFLIASTLGSLLPLVGNLSEYISRLVQHSCFIPAHRSVIAASPIWSYGGFGCLIGKGIRKHFPFVPPPHLHLMHRPPTQ